MKIVEINASNRGSTGKIMFGIADIARENGYDVLTCSPFFRSEYKCIENHYYIGSILERRISSFIDRLIGIQGELNFFATWRLIRTLNKYEPDIIHLHNLHGNYVNVRLLFSFLRKHDIHVVWTFHDCWPFTAYCAYFDVLKCSKWKNGCYKCKGYRRYPDSFLDNSCAMYNYKRKCFTSLEKLNIVTPSEWLKNLVKQSYFNKTNVSVINNGIDIKAFSPKQIYDERDGAKIKVLGCANVWEERKGLSYLNLLANELSEQIEVVVIGKLCGEISVESIDDKNELAEYYSRADILVNPTLEDNFPTVNLEALACGTPVITFDTGGSPESVYKETGIVINKGDYESLKAAVLEIGKKKKGTVQKCRKIAQKFDQEKMFLDYLDLYNVVNNNG